MDIKNQFEINTHRFYLLGLLALSFLLVILAIAIGNQRLSSRTKAGSDLPDSGGSAPISLDNSYVFASPLEAKADGVSIIRVTVFLLNNQGLGISGQKIQLRSSGPVNISQTQATTDSLGKAIFDLTSTTLGDYTITAEVSNQSLPQTVTVVFR